MDDYRTYFIKSLTDNYPKEFDVVIANTDKHYKNISIDTTFSKTSPNPIDKRLDFSSYFLALIKTLDEQGETFDTIRKICLEIVTEYVKPKNKVQEFFKRLLPKLTNTFLGQILIRYFHKRVSVNSNVDGFKANIITDKQETFGLGYGIDIIECGICKLFIKHYYQKYASILCEVDEITSSLAGLKLIRTGTIANGAKKCDFRFQKLN
jgi:L-2-amino-thiazoline-4-carboxylic acid hydrolase